MSVSTGWRYAIAAVLPSIAFILAAAARVEFLAGRRGLALGAGLIVYLVALSLLFTWQSNRGENT